jgi:hypothetical protein
MDQIQRDSKQLMDDLMVSLARKGFFFVGVIAYKEGVSDNETVRIGCGVDFYQHPKMRPLVIRMLRNAATILEADPSKRVLDVIELPTP